MFRVSKSCLYRSTYCVGPKRSVSRRSYPVFHHLLRSRSDVFEGKFASQRTRTAQCLNRSVGTDHTRPGSKEDAGLTEAGQMFPIGLRAKWLLVLDGVDCRLRNRHGALNGLTRDDDHARESVTRYLRSARKVAPGELQTASHGILARIGQTGGNAAETRFHDVDRKRRDIGFTLHR